MKLSKNIYILIFVLAFLLRLILMPSSAHSDLFAINAFPDLIYTEHVSDILSYSKENVHSQGFSYYPPLTFYTIGAFQFIDHIFSDTFSPWMVQLRNLYIQGYKGQAPEIIKKIPNQMIFRDIFLAKMPYILFEIGSIIILFVFIKRKELDRKILILWLFNPVLIYGAYIFGQFDIIPTFFVLLGLMLVDKKPTLGIFTIGIAAALKNYSFLFIIPLAVIYGKNTIGRLKLIIVGFLPAFIFIIPTLINNPDQAVYGFVNKVLVNPKKPPTGWSLYSQILHYIAFGGLYTAVIGLSFTKLSKWRQSTGICLIIILTLLTLAPKTSFHYLFWAFPFIVLWFRTLKASAIVLTVQTVSFASYKILAPQLQAGLFAPLNPDYFYSLPTFNDIINQLLPYKIVTTIGFFVFFVFNFYLIFTIIQELLFKTGFNFVKKDQKWRTSR